MNEQAQQSIRVSTFTGGVVGPSVPMIGPVVDGGTIIAETAPGCWGPMITPSFRGGHEVTTPVAVEGAKVGDAIAIRIRKVLVTSMATASGTMSALDDRYEGDPFVARHCPECGAESPATELEGIGSGAVRCAACGAETSPFRVSNGYTIVFDEARQMAVTVGPEVAADLARQAAEAMALPEESQQHPIVAMAPADIVGLVTRLRPFLGNIGTLPAIDIPDSHNAGDFGQLLIDAPHQYGIADEELAQRTDGHMDIDAVRAGSVLICPVKVEGGGIYVGDAHAMQGDGELAGHTTDVTAEVELEVSILKGLAIGGPILLPLVEDLPPLAVPHTAAERKAVERLAQQHGQEWLETAAPIQMVGTGANLNDATDNGVARLAELFGMSAEEVQNRVTISGAVEIGRLPGVVTVTMMTPLQKIEEVGLAQLVRSQYAL